MANNRNNHTEFKNLIYESFIKKPAFWVYLAFTFFAAGFGFYYSVLLNGSSNISSTAVFSIMAALFLAPFLTFGNNIRVKLHEEPACAVMKKWLEMLAAFCIGLIIYIPFAVIISKLGVFRTALYMNGIISILMVGIILVSANLFIANVFKSKLPAYIIMYALAAALIADELLLGVCEVGTAAYRLLYSVSLSKFNFGLSAGIFDWKMLVVSLCVSVLFILLTIYTMEKRQAKRERNSAKLIILLVLAAVTIICIALPGSGSAIYGVDMTPSHFYTAGVSSSEYMATIEDDVTVTVFESKNDFVDKYDYSAYFVQAARIIEQLADCSKGVKLEFDGNAEFPADVEGASKGDILITTGDKWELIKSEELFNFSYYTDADGNMYSYIVSSRVEEAICSGVADVLAENSEKAVFLLGNGENENYKNLAALLEAAGYQVEYADANGDEVPEAKLVIIFAPSQDYYDTSALEEYMYNDGQYGRNLLYVANSNYNSTPANLNSFLENWGITVENYSIIESEPENYTKNEMYGINEYIEYSFITDFTYLEDPAVVPYSRNIAVDEENTYMTYRILLQSKDTSYLANSNTMLDEYTNYYTALIAAYYQTNVFGNTYTGITGNVAVIGSEHAFDTDVLESDDYSNAAYFTDVMRELMGENNVSVSLTDRSMTLKSVEATKTDIVIMNVIFMLVLPAAMLAGGIIEKLRDRRRVILFVKKRR